MSCHVMSCSKMTTNWFVAKLLKKKKYYVLSGKPPSSPFSLSSLLSHPFYALPLPYCPDLGYAPCPLDPLLSFDVNTLLLFIFISILVSYPPNVH